MSVVVDTETLLASPRLPTIDVRSPGEFQSGHIPGAENVPLLNDAERAEVGTLYKQVSRESAVTRGLEIVNAKTEALVAKVKRIANGPELHVHCWRGGMRSEGFADLLEENGFRPRRLRGGYKAYRQAAHECFAESRRVVILAGHTGAGKTLLLGALRESGQQIVDLEQLANHRGSVFGGIDQPEQPSCEQFENNLFREWRELDSSQPVWIEGESRSIGRTYIPQPVWDQMMSAPTIFVQVPRGERIRFLVEQYGSLSQEKLAAAVTKIKKRLGGLRLNTALESLRKGDLHTFAGIALEYYDKAYMQSLEKSRRHVNACVPLKTHDQAGALQTLTQLGQELVGSSRSV
jgi:tRNA 2-selenouridine synthase